MNQVEIRKRRGGREGLSMSTHKLTITSLTILLEYCTHKRITWCKKITPKILHNFKDWLQLLQGVKVKNLSTSYLNRTLRIVKTFLNSYKIESPPVFTDIPALTATLKSFPNNSILPFHFEVNDLQTILRAALQLDKEQCKVSRELKDMGKNFKGDLPLKNVPLFPTIALTMLTGARKSEILGLRWSDIDLQSGIIKISQQRDSKTTKTGKSRLIPLIDKTYKAISPSLLELLRIWKLKTQDDYVLPHPQSDKPSELKHPLEKFRKDIKIPELTFQNLRKNFTSYVVSFGVNPTIAAFWLGHSPAVAEKHYLSYAIGALKGDTVEESMGISEILKEAIAGFKGSGTYENLKLVKWA